MPNENDGTGTGDGKTPTVEELLAQMKTMQEAHAAEKTGFESRLSDMTAAQERLTQLLEAASKRGEPAPTTGGQRKLARDFAAEFNLSNEAAMALVDEAVKAAEENLTARWQQAEALKEVANKFYDDNKDLKEHKSIVQAIANDLRAKEPNLTMGQALDKTAVKAREYIKSIRDKKEEGGGGDPPEVLPGTQRGSGGNDPKPKDKELTPEEELAEDIKQRRQNNAKALR